MKGQSQNTTNEVGYIIINDYAGDIPFYYSIGFLNMGNEAWVIDAGATTHVFWLEPICYYL